jgi:uncharacterized protein YndB with AHSA1/START domain
MTSAQQNKAAVSAQGEREIHTERVFNAPRERVYAAFTDPELIPRWWGRRKDTVTVDKMDVREGGEWRFVTKADDGEHAFRGVYRKLSPPEMVEQTFEWEGMKGYVIVETSTFEDLGDGRTRVVTDSLFHTGEERDGMLASGMETGMNESYEKLDELLASQE